MRAALLLLLAASVCAEQACRGPDCSGSDSEGAGKYSREKNQPKQEIRAQMAKLQSALLNLMKDPYNPEVLRSSLADLALFADTPEGKRFLERFGDVMDGNGGGASGALIRQIFGSVLAGNVDFSKLMTDGISASTLATLATGLLKKDGGGGNGIKMEDLKPIMQNFMQVIKDEQASPFLLDRLTDAFKETMTEAELKKFERSAAGVLGGIKAASNLDDSDFVYDQSALETFESFMQDFVDEQEWDWSRTGSTFMREVKKVMRAFPGSEDQIGRLLPSLMEVIADEKPSEKELPEIITNFGGILGNAVKKDSAEPELVKLMLQKLKTPLDEKTKESEPENEAVVEEENPEDNEIDTEPVEDVKSKAKSRDDTPKSEGKKATISADEVLKKAEDMVNKVPDLSKLTDSLSAIANDPVALQALMMKAASGGLDMNSISSMLPEVDGMEDITAYLSQIQNSKDEKEVAGHFHAVMDSVGDAFSLLNSEDIRRSAIEQGLPYIRMVHDFLKEPLALMKIQMGVASLASMYDTSVEKLIDMAAPIVEEYAEPMGIHLDFKSFCDDTHKFFLKVYNEVYQSRKSPIKKLSGVKEDQYIVETVDHSVGEPVMLAYSAYRQVRRRPECLLQALCRANREAKETDAGAYGVRSTVTKSISRLFGMLLASVEHEMDSVVHDQVTEAVAEGQADGNCEKLYPADCDEDPEELDVIF
ncbi:hypothetical protein FJT64_012471 [Amphibalanus amphitrite]|uniref:Protein G12 n=1 Tax=Amphibalanus amphitrite TaxID=1232801 RepID=A0A6A4UZB9_AMPAM|nr:hypothetical protein FJT64_012471 [Amphibalanus amphitrite]